MTVLALLLNRNVLAGFGIAALLAFSGVQTWRIDRLHHDLIRARDEAADVRRQSAGWAASYRQAEALRLREHGEAVATAQAAAGACDVRIAEARRSAGAIVRLVQRPPAHDAAGCPAREVIGGAELDQVFGGARR